MRFVLAAVLTLLTACSQTPDPDAYGTDPYARYLAALEMGEEGDLPGVVRLLSDPEAFVRGGAVVALGWIGGPKVTPEVIQMTFQRGANDALVRSEACRVLSTLGDERGIPALVAAVRGDTSYEVRRTAALALEPFAKDRRVLEALVDALGDPSAAVVYNAHGVLSRATSRADLPRERAPWQDWLRTQ